MTSLRSWGVVSHGGACGGEGSPSREGAGKGTALGHPSLGHSVRSNDTDDDNKSQGVRWLILLVGPAPPLPAGRKRAKEVPATTKQSHHLVPPTAKLPLPTLPLPHSCWQAKAGHTRQHTLKQQGASTPPKTPQTPLAAPAPQPLLAGRSRGCTRRTRPRPLCAPGSPA